MVCSVVPNLDMGRRKSSHQPPTLHSTALSRGRTGRVSDPRSIARLGAHSARRKSEVRSLGDMASPDPLLHLALFLGQLPARDQLIKVREESCETGDGWSPSAR